MIPTPARRSIAHASALLAGAWLAGAALAGTIESISLDAGRDFTVLETPLFAAAEGFHVELGAFDSVFDYTQLLVDDYGGSGTKDMLDPSVDLGALFTEELRRQAREMGLPSGVGGWRVTGTVEDVSIRNREVFFGPLLFYGHVDVAVDVTSPDGAATTALYRAHPTTARFNAGFGAKDENREAIAQILIIAVQDLVARLNREHFGQPAVARLSSMIAIVEGAGGEAIEGAVRWLGLSGDARAVDPLLTVARDNPHASMRVAAVEGLSLLGAADAVPALVQRYAGEDEDVRCALLGAIHELDAEAGKALAASKGVRDGSKACRHGARRILGQVR